MIVSGRSNKSGAARCAIKGCANAKYRDRLCRLHQPYNRDDMARAKKIARHWIYLGVPIDCATERMMSIHIAGELHRVRQDTLPPEPNVETRAVPCAVEITMPSYFEPGLDCE